MPGNVNSQSLDVTSVAGMLIFDWPKLKHETTDVRWGCGCETQLLAPPKRDGGRKTAWNMLKPRTYANRPGYRDLTWPLICIMLVDLVLLKIVWINMDQPPISVVESILHPAPLWAPASSFRPAASEAALEKRRQELHGWSRVENNGGIYYINNIWIGINSAFSPI